MNSTYVLIALSGAGLGFVTSWLLSRTTVNRQLAQIRQMDASLQDRDRESFRVEKAHREEIKRLEIQHAESQRERIRELTSKESEFNDRLRAECKRVADDAREQAKMQFEQQQKLFSVEVRPYLEVNEVGNYFKTKYEKKIGYQYQLLVNGIPALQPHVITESKEVVDKTKDENIDKVASQALQAAQQVAQAVIESSLGGAGAFVRMGKAIKRLPGGNG